MNKTRSHIAEIELEFPPEQVFKLLHTPSLIRQWWSADQAIVTAEQDGLWAACWGDEDSPKYMSAGRIKVFDPPRRLSLHEQCYYAFDGGPPFEATMTTSFEIDARDSGCVLRVVQGGFPSDPIADEFYAGCEVGWRNTLAGIKQCLESMS